MNALPRLVSTATAIACVCALIPSRTVAQAPVPQNRVVHVVNMNDRVTLAGNTHPFTRSSLDQGAVAGSEPMNRMLLLLQRSPGQEAQLRQLLDEQQDKSSPNYHKWLTPADFGRQFGVSDADLQAVTDWLASQGFSGIKVTAGRTLVEFTGNAQQVRNAFQTDIHQYLRNEKTYSANASDPQVPAALSPVIAGVVSLNNFPRKSFVHRLGTFQKSLATGETKPLFTFSGCQAGNCYAVGPPDFATIYNTAPLLHASPAIDGTGVTIAVVGETNIDVQDVSDFRTIFGLPQNFTAQNIILNGPDPGINDSETESDLDVQWSGAVAPGAKIDFVASEPTETTAGIDLSAIYIVDNNLAPIMSESFGVCEQTLGTTGNQFYNALWEQAAAQGITVILSSGDGGSAGCDDFNSQQTATRGLAVSGFASTPFNIAVGGTDFDQVSRWANFWNANPTSTTPPVPSSALSYIPETPWNDSCARNGITSCGTGSLLDIVAASGGASTIYSKPSFQLGVSGMPNDNHRDLPDVSLFASNGFNGSFYIVCQRDATGAGSCNLNNFGFTFQGIGGTSASAPAFAGIMALVNQKTGQRQGNANYTLYSLAKLSGASCNSNGTTLPAATCTFNDVTKGNNAVPCAGKSPNCSSAVTNTNGVLFTTSGTTKIPAYTAGTGYDLATGLGSFNAQNLVNNWTSVNGTATSTTLNLNNGTAVSVAHGTSVPVQISVTPTASKGDVSLIAQLANGNTLGVGSFTLGANGSVSGTTSALPGGSNYAVHAHYAGDGTHAPSDSSTVNVTVNPEASATLISLPTFDPTTGAETGNAPASFVYGSPYIMRVDVGNASAHLSFPAQPLCQRSACPTGTVTIKDNGSTAAPNGGAFTLNSEGFTEDQPVQFSGGQHTITASYSGDSSFNPSSASYALTVTPAPSSIQLQIPSAPIVMGQPFIVEVVGGTHALSGDLPTGTVTFFDGASQIGSPFPIQTFSNSPAFQVLTDLSVTTAGDHSITAVYSGDANYATSTSNAIVVHALYPTTCTITATPSNIQFGDSITITAVADTLVPSSDVSLKPTGTVLIGGTLELVSIQTTTVTTDASGNWEIQTIGTAVPRGPESYNEYYNGETNYAGCTAFSNLVNVNIPDFTLGPSNGLSVIPVAGQAASGQITITPLSQTPSTVTLQLPFINMPGYTVTLSPQQINLNGQPVTATITLTPTVGNSSSNLANRSSRHAAVPVGTSGGGWWFLSASVGAITLALIALPGRRRRLPLAFAAGFVCLLCVSLGCGGGGSSFTPPGGGGGGTPPPPPPAATTIALTTSNPKAIQNQPFTITATVTSTRSATGDVTFFDNGTIRGSLPLNNGQTQTPPGFFQGPALYEITATYNGDSNNAPSTSAPITQAVTGTFSIFIQGNTGTDTHIVQVNLGLQ